MKWADSLSNSFINLILESINIEMILNCELRHSNKEKTELLCPTFST